MNKPVTTLSATLCAMILLATPPLLAQEITDQRGKTITVTTPAQRVAYIPPALWSYLQVDGSSDHVVGSSAFALRAMEQGLMPALFAKAAQIPDVTSNGFFAPNVEAVLATQPEVVFQTIQIGPEPYAALEQIGLPVIGISGVRGEEDMLEWVRLAGEVSGKKTRAEEIVTRVATERSKLDEQLAAIPEEKRPKVLYLFKVEPIRLMQGAFTQQAIHHAGGRNVAEKVSGNGVVNFEQVLNWDPDVILISGWPEEKSIPQDLYQSAQWSTLRAVKERRVYKAAMDGARNGIALEPLFWQWLAELLHPDTMEPRLRAQYRDIFMQTFTYPLSEQQLDWALHTTANKDSAGVNRFLAQP
ncbi:MAG: ABC transporter substrate-binding protein [Magnetococcales bacterium]|nr:ABC transporter substrate-binding protein [Magnetococcales bacterium]MBF0115806.1 ABC transporter substrate-binding protein [Magnetococcales bacterium]